MQPVENFITIPSDIFYHHIAPHLSVNDLLQINRVSQSAHQLIENAWTENSIDTPANRQWTLVSGNSLLLSFEFISSIICSEYCLGSRSIIPESNLKKFYDEKLSLISQDVHKYYSLKYSLSELKKFMQHFNRPDQVALPPKLISAAKGSLEYTIIIRIAEENLPLLYDPQA